MPYGTLKCDNIVFTNGGSDQTITVSGLIASTSGNLTVTGTVSGNIIQGGTLVSGATVTGGIGQFTTLTGGTAGFTTITGTTVTGTTANFASGNFTNISGGIYTITSGVFASGTAANPSISFAGDSNTGIYASAVDQVSITTSGTERLRVDAAGQIEAVSLGSASAPTYSFTTDPNTGIYSPGADQLAISSNSLQRLVVGSDGRIQINATSAGVTLDTYSAESTGIAYRVRARTTDGVGAIQFTDNGATTQYASIQTPAANTLAFLTQSTERLRLTSDGRLGLGTSSPSKLLHVAGSTLFGANNAAVGHNFKVNNDVELALYSDAAGYIVFDSFLGSTPATKQDIYFNKYGGYSLFGSRVGIGTTSPSNTLSVVSASSSIALFSGNNANNFIAVSDNNGTNFASFGSIDAGDAYIFSGTGKSTRLYAGNAERARIDSSGRLLVGTSSARSISSAILGGGGAIAELQVEGTALAMVSFTSNRNDGFGPYLALVKSRGTAAGSFTLVSNGDGIGALSFNGTDGSAALVGAAISAFVDGTPGANDMPGRLVFSTTADGAASPTERMRITQNGAVRINAQTAANAELFYLKGNATDAAATIHQDTTSSITQIYFLNPNGNVGSITTNGSATAYNTSSDYRLKENVVAVATGISRLQQLKPSRFNFIADPGKTVDGFIAHEVQDVVPEAVHGEKDAVDADGDPVYQGIDQSKLVPLLTAALQEAVAKIESLEARLTAAGI
jgi:hypothetical protein